MDQLRPASGWPDAAFLGRALFDELEKSLAGLGNVCVERIEAHINDQAFIERAIEVFQNLLYQTQSSTGTLSS